MYAIYLTKQERELFDAFPSTVKEGWAAETEEGTFDDTRERMTARLSLVRLHDPKLIAFCEKLKANPAKEAVEQLLDETDLRDVSDDDMAELVFALGPNLLTQLTLPMLRNVKTSDELQQVASLLFVRHSLFDSLHS